MTKHPDLLKFQSTLPLRGATHYFVADTGWVAISIHAPLAGSDLGWFGGRYVGYISIHAPLAGSDTVALMVGTEIYEFQSTLPLRGATISY